MRLHACYLQVLVALTVFIAATGTSYFFLDYFQAFHREKEKIPPRLPGEEAPKIPIGGQKTLLFSLGTGLGAGAVAFVVWEGGKRTKKDAVAVLLEEGLDDVTVKGVEIVRHMMSEGEFTVRELTDSGRVSRTHVWRLVKELADNGLVEETEKEKPSQDGRGKPSRIYRFTGSER